MSDNPFSVYSCRFEFSHDYTAFVVAADKCGVLIATSELSHMRIREGGDPLPDVYVEFHAKVDLEAIRNIMRSVIDMHVPIQTLKQAPLKGNRLERDYTIT